MHLGTRSVRGEVLSVIGDTQEERKIRFSKYSPPSPLPTKLAQRGVFLPGILQFPSLSGKQIPRVVGVRSQHDHILATGKADESI